MEIGSRELRLTELASCGGCAAKYSAARLEQLLTGFAPAQSDDLLVGLDPADDAAVYRLDAERALVFTLEFFERRHEGFRNIAPSPRTEAAGLDNEGRAFGFGGLRKRAAFFCDRCSYH